MKLIISRIVALATAFVCVSAHELRGGPNLLSGVKTDDSDLKTDGGSPEWYPKTKFIAYIPEEKGRTDPWNHKAGITKIIEKINKTTKIINEAKNQ
ncbi:hypothetical protein ACHAXA_005392 [Cyclostephanos tholiformis]|uniref:Uncharacterized protein n=1 Tax=Cyclostephanos tholiformis TaxID=382380 RepID=A0ABD3R0Y2_9STRA